MISDPPPQGDYESIRAGLAALDPLEREALTLVYFQQRTQAEIAETLSVAPAVIARAISQALQRLAMFLTDGVDTANGVDGFDPGVVTDGLAS